MKSAVKRRKTRNKTSEPMKPYLKTMEVKGLYRPANEVEIAAEAPAAAAPAQGFSLASSFGGIDSMIAMMGKAQQMFKLFQQMAPMFKLLNSFGGAKALTAGLAKSRSHIYLGRRKINARKRLTSKK
ncbi:hypothetical protein SAMN03159341_105227 [Paenibacillus sp. 1_12]|uniref:hypothetical protein n=1 Tax=Paenibacillus sp. 1_12 TaxID=1566278 RepID=UPI0008E456C8|nr:hypothetical protein [Paenibacillus sp. 1_12]SFL35380.1 hypothetical protein SAMN03159341_105227 [Paenibacillus sp. 1_12]